MILLIAGSVLGAFFLYDTIYGEIQTGKIRKHYCERINRREILRESFYDESKKAEHSKNVQVVLNKHDLVIRKRIASGQEIYKESDLYTERVYLRELLKDIQFDRYQYELLDMPREDRRLDDWNLF
ncbi:hypothetical protein A5819_003517 [Enterococcus sp. 7E2_DIV0204]|uniref:hypothetical protein n=1 Tax=unclassified Enterococcus TaxID=2608891 RepID=UPI000A34A193|nr:MULTISPECIES: hypothetical protein [unclassified Enterococcus]OTN83967.1 hypothetical protein A5819_003517 [Enterococcus sp. 7E2_DIV0204]OTP46875.1 hypothetical protein A5884_003753 [Enterococcus sp. 7D2_DIV0200]